MFETYKSEEVVPIWAHSTTRKSSASTTMLRLVGRICRYLLFGVVSFIAFSFLQDVLKKSSTDLTIANPATSPVSVSRCGSAGGHGTCSKIGKLSMLFDDSDELLGRALAIHQRHNERYGYSHSILRKQVLSGASSKPAFILQSLVSELTKPEAERLEWLVWFDSDTVLLNPKIPLEIFLPPRSDWGHIHALMTNDAEGLNSAVIFLKVHEWSAWLVNAWLAADSSSFSTQTSFGDDPMLMHWISQERFRNNVMHVPQRWFNAHPGYRGDQEDGIADPEAPSTKFRPNSAREGDLMVHPAGSKSMTLQRMRPWVEFAEKRTSRWELDLQETSYIKQIETFWNTDAARERKTQNNFRAKLAEAAQKKNVRKAAKARLAHQQQLEQQQALSQSQSNVEAAS